MSFAWRVRRLAAMEPREVLWRSRQALRSGFERMGMFAPRVPRYSRARVGNAWLTDWPKETDADKYKRAADRILAGEFDIFALRPARIGFPPPWNRDPKTGREAPLTFGKFIDYRNEKRVGDIKYVWEPARHAALVTLAQAWRLTGDAAYSAGCRTLLDSWFAQCPYPLGPHWISALEHGLRLLNWTFAWFLLGGEDSPLFRSDEGRVFRERWLTSVYQHCRFIAANLSRFSSANNHLLGELTGLLSASLTWPGWPESVRWRDSAHGALEREALRQNGDDGVNREQAVWYHHEVADMLLAAGLLARANGADFSPAYWRRLERMLDFVASIMDVHGHVPTFGDSDDAVVVPLDPDGLSNVFRSQLATGAVLFDRADFAAKAGDFDDKSRWLLGDGAAERFTSLRSMRATQLPVRREFPCAGYYVLGAAFETPQEVRIVADAGPLGFTSIAAHGHADALSFTLSAGGEELLIDPGTYAYHTQRRWRDYFRGTSAHNTVRIDARDQSETGGAFLWTSHAQARVIRYETSPDGDRLVAEHDGYTRLADPVLHRRELVFEPGRNVLTVLDDLLCAGEHDVELFWHFAEPCEVRLLGRRAWAVRNGVELVMTLPDGVRHEIFRGSETPPLGWISRRFDERSPCTTIRARTRVRGNTRFETQLAVFFRRRRVTSDSASDSMTRADGGRIETSIKRDAAEERVSGAGCSPLQR